MDTKTFCKIFSSMIRLNILKGLLQFNKRVTATNLTKMSKFRRIPSEELDFLMSIGLINSEKEGKERFISLTEKGMVVIKRVIEIERLFL